jgi:streptogramin lyase
VEALEERRLLAPITEFSAGITAGSTPAGITVGADGNLWFTEYGNNALGRITPLGAVTEFSLAALQAGSQPQSITSGPGGLLYFAESAVGRIGRINPRAGSDALILASLTQSAVVPAGAGALGYPPGLGGLGGSGLTAGPDGNLWFTESSANKIGNISPDLATINEIPMSQPAAPFNITTGPDGALWFTEFANQIGRATTSGMITESKPPPVQAFPLGITAGPDGNLWFTALGCSTRIGCASQTADQIGRVTTSGIVTEFALPNSAAPVDITAGPDGNLWFTEATGNQIGRITPTGTMTTYGTGITAGSGPDGIVTGPDGNLWFTEGAGRIGRLIPDAPLTATAVAVKAGAGTPFSGPVASLTDGDVSALPGDFSVTINWGDSTPLDTTSGTVAAVPGQPGHFVIRGSHTYANTGSVTITVTITDTNTTTSVGGSTATATDNGMVLPPTTTALQGPTTVAAGQAVTYTATVTSGATGTPTGNVDLVDGATIIDTVSLVGNKATFDVSLSPAGSHSLTAVYEGDASFPGSTSAALDVTVGIATATLVAPSVNPSYVGETVTFTATVVPSSGSAIPTGTVMFMDTTTSQTLGTATLDNTGKAAVSTAGLVAGSHTITASYSGDLSFAPSSGMLTQTVNATQAPAFTSAAGTTFTVGAAGTFTVAAAGSPPPTLSESGSDILPGGVSFDPTTGLLSGTPAAGSGGVHTLHFTAHNGISPDATQMFTLTVDQPPGFTSPAGTTFTTGAMGSFTVTAGGYPPPTLSESPGDLLPPGVSFNPTSGVLSGTPAAGSGAAYTLHFTAHNSVGSDATQTFALTVDQPLAITSAANTTFTTGALGSFTVIATGFPAPSLSARAGDTLPGGVTFNAATGVLSGTPAAGSGGSYTLHLTASNGVGSDASQTFTLTVEQPPAFTSPALTTFVVGAAGTFTVTAGGSPAPTLSESALDTPPAGVTFNAMTGVLSGTPAAGSGGVYTLHFTAHNGVGTDATQAFTLTVDEAPRLHQCRRLHLRRGDPGQLPRRRRRLPGPHPDGGPGRRAAERPQLQSGQRRRRRRRRPAERHAGGE